MSVIRLGNFIRQLSACKPEAYVRFDFGGFLPDGIDSYRGYYDHLALGFREPNDTSVKVADLLALLKGAVGTTYSGYKGGEYTMNEHTPVWVGNYGQCSDTAVCGIYDNDYEVVIQTEFHQSI